MTCIIGLHNKEEQNTCLIGDRMATSDIERNLPYPKIIEIPIRNSENKILIGAAGYLRTINFLQSIKDCLLTSDDILDNKYDFDFLIDIFVPRIRDFFKNSGEEDILKRSELLIATPDGLFYVDGAGAVTPEEWFAIGSGKIAALTVIDYIKSQESKEENKSIEIEPIMKSISKYASGVSEQFDIFYTKEV